MRRKAHSNYDLLAVGEILADLIGHEIAENLSTTTDFRKYAGGSPANLASNMARLGNRTALVSCVGNDNIGKYLTQKVHQSGIDTQFIQTCELPTSIVLVSRSTETPDFIAYREADKEISVLPDNLLAKSNLFHTTCFALSKNPAQKNIIESATKFAKNGGQLSIDLNYAPQIWQNKAEAWQIIDSYCALKSLTKLSLDDAFRLFGEELPVEKIIKTFLQKGSSLVCLTLGKDGSWLCEQNQAPIFVPTTKITQIADATGAGDSYWSGFLTAWLDEKNLEFCGKFAVEVAKIKLQNMGGSLQKDLNKQDLYKNIA